MFDVHPIVWLQSWASPFVTGVMNGVSLFGYTSACLALAVLLIFGFRRRAALALLVLLAVNGAMTDAVKTIGAMPRPDGVSADVQSLALFTRGMPAHDERAAASDSYGFPSGHVSATTAFAVGLGVLFGFRRRGWTLVVLWIGVMALSRMYLGRHFLGDVLGGAGLGLASVALSLFLLRAGRFGQVCEEDEWRTGRLLMASLVAIVTAVVAGLPDASDAGRLAGTGVGLWVLLAHDVFAGRSVRGGVLLVVSAAAGFGLVWGLTMLVPGLDSESRASVWRLVAAALPSAALLIAPALVPRRLVA